MLRVPALRLTGACVAFALLAGSPARADLIAWQEHFDASPHVVKASDNPGSGVILAADTKVNTIHGSTHLAALSLKTFSAAKATDPAHFTGEPFSSLMFVKDQASGVLGAVTFTGV